MTMSEEYWEIRDSEAAYNHWARYAEKAIEKQYSRGARITLRELTSFFSGIKEEVKQGNVLMSHLYRYNRYYDILNQFNSRLKQIGETEYTITEKAMHDMYIDNYKIIGRVIGVPPTIVSVPNEEKIREAINHIWCKDGNAWSSRIWNNKNKLVEMLENGITDVVARGSNEADLERMLMDVFKVGYYQAQRIVRTELTYVQNQSAIDRYSDSDIELYQIWNTKDGRTCEICQEQKGKIYKITEAEAGKNLPPFHSNCRCTVIPYLPEMN